MVDTPQTIPTLIGYMPDTAGTSTAQINAQELRNMVKTLESRSFFSVTQYGAVGDNNTDNSTAMQNAINDCASAGGGIVWVPPSGGYYKINTGLKLPCGVCLMGAGTKNQTRGSGSGGVGSAWVPTSFANRGSWICSTDTVNPAVKMVGLDGGSSSGTGTGAGARIQGMNFVSLQNSLQANASNPAWTPTVYPYVIDINDQFQTVDNVMIHNATHGISITGNNILGVGDLGGTGVSVTNVNMHVYNVGIHMEGVDDCVLFDKINIENILGGDATVNWMLNHLVGFDIHRADNLWMSNVQLFVCNVGIQFSNGVDAQNRSMTNSTLSNLQFNLCTRAMSVLANDTFVSGTISSSIFANTPLNFVLTSVAPPTSGVLLDFWSNNVSLIFTGCTFLADNSVLTIGNGGFGTENLLGYPSVVFSASEFIASSGSSNPHGACFNVFPNAVVATSAQLYNLHSGIKKGGSGKLIEAMEQIL